MRTVQKYEYHDENVYFICYGFNNDTCNDKDRSCDDVQRCRHSDGVCDGRDSGDITSCGDLNAIVSPMNINLPGLPLIQIIRWWPRWVGIGWVIWPNNRNYLVLSFSIMICWVEIRVWKKDFWGAHRRS